MAPDITMCQPKKIMKKCNNCYRMKAEPSMYQSYADFYEECKKNKYEHFLKIRKAVKCE